jgi:hypothetical protein
MPESPRDPLAELRERLGDAERAARRLAAELPGSGGDDAARARRAQEAQALAALLSSLRALVPPELEGQLRDLARQVLLVLRALIDRSLAGLAPSTDDEPVVHDIEVS